MTNPNELLAHDLLQSGEEHFQLAIHPQRVLFWAADSRGNCELVSANWHAMTGQATQEALVTGWLDTVHAQDRQRIRAAVQCAVSDRQGLFLHYRLQHPNGLIRHVLHDAAVRTLPSGAFNGLIGTLTEDSGVAPSDPATSDPALPIYQFLDGVSLASIAITPQGTLLHSNQAMAALLQTAQTLLMGAQWLQRYVAADDRAMLAALLNGNAPLSSLPPEIEYQLDTPTGRRLYRWHLTLLRTAAGVPHCIAMMGTDITQWRQIGDQQRLTAQMFDTSKEAMVITDRNNSIISVNPAFTRLTGYSRDDVLGQNPRVLQSGKHDPAFYQAMWRSILEQGYWRGDIWDRRKDGTYYPKFLAISTMCDPSGQINNFSAVFYDISERKQMEARLENLAHYDALTGLPNRMLLQDRLEQAIASAERLSQHFALLFIDLDGFKPVNDRFGHAFGDEVLRRVAQRLSTAIRSMDTAARLGGDEFVVILTDIQTSDIAQQVAQSIVVQLGAPYEIAGESITVSASIGVSIYPDDERSPNELLRIADVAMYRAKTAGKQQVIFYGGLA